MSLFLSFLIPAWAADDCARGSCPKPHDHPVPAAVADADTDPPPIDLPKAAHLETATFALG